MSCVEIRAYRVLHFHHLTLALLHLTHPHQPIDLGHLSSTRAHLSDFFAALPFLQKFLDEVDFVRRVTFLEALQIVFCVKLFNHVFLS